MDCVLSGIGWRQRGVGQGAVTRVADGVRTRAQGAIAVEGGIGQGEREHERRRWSAADGRLRICMWPAAGGWAGVQASAAATRGGACMRAWANEGAGWARVSGRWRAIMRHHETCSGRQTRARATGVGWLSMGLMGPMGPSQVAARQPSGPARPSAPGALHCAACASTTFCCFAARPCCRRDPSARPTRAHLATKHAMPCHCCCCLDPPVSATPASARSLARYDSLLRRLCGSLRWGPPAALSPSGPSVSPGVGRPGRAHAC